MLAHDPISSKYVLETIKARHSIRRFTGQAVPEAELMALLEAANNAPSAHNQQSWRFIIIRGRKKAELAELINRKSSGFPREVSALLRMASRTIACAPISIAVINTGELVDQGARFFPADLECARDFFRIMEIQSSAAAVENLLIAATSLGLASVWLGILYLIKEDVLAWLEEPRGEFMAVIPMGYPSRSSTGPRKRPILDKVRNLD
ncbi:MAG: nitroreductase family protein [candidate division FCPU426 bacterium]